MPERAADGDARQDHILEIGCIIVEQMEHAFEVVFAGNFLRFELGLVQSGQQHAGQDRDDGDHDQEFYQRKTGRFTLQV